MRVLVVKLSSLGDVVHALPVVADILAARPEARIDWIVEPAFAPLVRRVQGVAEVIECPLRRWTRAGLWKASTRAEMGGFVRRLRRDRYDAVLDLQGLSKSALIAWLARGPSYALANRTEGASHEWPTRVLATKAITVAPRSHALDRSRELVAKALGTRAEGPPSFGLAGSADAAAMTFPTASPNRLPAAAPVVFLPGASRADKLWPEASWIELGRRLAASGGRIAIVRSSVEEGERAERIAAALGTACTVWPTMALDALVDRLASSSGAIGVDSGPSHIAVALGLPHVQIYNFPTSWRTGPQARHGAHHQVSVEAGPTPTVQAVWSAWRGLRGEMPATHAPAVQEGRAMSGALRRALARAAYSTLLRLAVPLYALRLLWRARSEPLYGSAMGERFGFYRRASVPGALWVHAVSLGETLAAGALIAEVRRQRPDLRVLLTHGTATGRNAGAALVQAGDEQAWLPFDTPGAVRRFMRRFAPLAGVLMETEIWPNLLAAAHARALPVLLANARLSERSRRRGRRVDVLLRPAFESLHSALAQAEADAVRLREAGVGTVSVAGNLKFDLSPDPLLIALGKRWRTSVMGAVVLAAVTREGEEAALLAGWRALAAPRPLLVIVPRHPQRFETVAELVVAAGFVLLRRSSWSEAPPAQAGSAEVWLGDSMLEMPAYYALADVALLGGSFLPLGGQNLIEAAACGCPIVMGPHTFNFADAAELSLAAGAALRVGSMQAGIAEAVALLGSDGLAVRSRAALAFAAAHRGAAERSANRVVALLPHPATGANRAPAPG